MEKAIRFDLILPAGTKFIAHTAPVTRVRPGEESDRPESKDKAERTARAAEQDSAGLPVAVQVAARHCREDIVLAVLRELERHFRPQPNNPAQPPT